MTESETESPTSFTFSPVDKKPTRKYRKGSKYDPVLDAFKEGKNNLVAVNIPGKDANYIRTQLNKRIEANERKYKGFAISVVNEVCYLEKNIKPKPE